MSEHIAENDVPLATRLADPGDYVREQLIEGDFGDPWDMPLWQREHLARVIEHYAASVIPSGRSRFLGLMYERSRLLKAGIEPTRVLLPARLNVPHDGEDATDFEGSCMGLPITWSQREEWGLVVTLPEPRTTVFPPAVGKP